MAVPNKHLVTLLFNKYIKPEFDWIKGIFVDDFDVKTEKVLSTPVLNGNVLQTDWVYRPMVHMKFRIFVDFNADDVDDYMKFEKKVGEDSKRFTDLIMDPKTYRYIGLGTLYPESIKGNNLEFELINDDEEEKQPTEIEERIINIFPKKSPPTSLGMF